MYLGVWVTSVVADLHAVRRPRPTQGCRADDVGDDIHAIPLS